uniref:Heat repeat-containing protein 2 n=1 Tax=Tetraselmis sp. GSL018 TaxID=582737 RepID=A0A061S1R9_9CHLO
MLGVTDSGPSIGKTTIALLAEAGERFHMAQETAARSASEASAAPSADTDMPDASTSSCGEDCSWAGPPYDGCRLSRFARELVRSQAQALVKAALRDLRDWSASNRLMGARLLHTVLVHLGAAAEDRADTLIPALCSSVSDDDADIAARVVSCVHVLGASTSFPLMLDQLACGQQTAARQASNLVVLSGLLFASGSVDAGSRSPLPAVLIERMAAILASEDTRGQDHPAVKQQLLACARNLVRLAGRDAEHVAPSLLMVLLQLKTDPSQAALCAEADEALCELAEACGRDSGAALVGEHAPGLLERISRGHSSWSAASADRHMLAPLLWAASPEAVGAMAPLALPILRENIAQKAKDPVLRIDLLQMVDGLLEDSERCHAFAGDAGVRLLRDVLLPSCVWSPGKTAAAIRFRAIAAAATFFRQQLISQGDLVELIRGGEILPVLNQCLEEEYYADTRLVSCHVMAGLLRSAGGALGDDSRRAIYPELCKRLDDSSDQNRAAACEALLAFAEVSPHYDPTNTKYLLDRLLIHMDDFNRGIQEAVCKVVVRIAGSKPALVKEEATKAAPRHRSKEFIERVLSACEAAQR